MPQVNDENSGADILDATQNAVIDAVNSVSEMIEKTTTESTVTPNTSHEVFYQSAEFWVGMAFVLVVVALFKPAGKALKQLLSRRRERIIKELDDAASLHSEAQKLLAQYERQFLNTKNEVQEIIEKTEQEIKTYQTNQSEQLEKKLSKRQKEADRVIETAIEKTRDEMNFAISQKATSIVIERIKAGLTKKQRSKLIDQSISNILKNL